MNNSPQIALCLLDNETEQNLRARVGRLLPSVAVTAVHRCGELNSILRDFNSSKLIALVGVSECEIEDIEVQLRETVRLFSEQFEFVVSLPHYDSSLVRRLFALGAVDYIVAQGIDRDQDCDEIAKCLFRRVQRFEALSIVDESEPPDQSLDSLKMNIRQVTFSETVATLNHRINNPLSIILGDAEMLLREEGAEISEAGLRRLEEIKTSAERIGDFTGRLRHLRDFRTVSTAGGDMLVTDDQSDV